MSKLQNISGIYKSIDALASQFTGLENAYDNQDFLKESQERNENTIKEQDDLTSDYFQDLLREQAYLLNNVKHLNSVQKSFDQELGGLKNLVREIAWDQPIVQGQTYKELKKNIDSSINDLRENIFSLEAFNRAEQRIVSRVQRYFEETFQAVNQYFDFPMPTRMQIDEIVNINKLEEICSKNFEAIDTIDLDSFKRTIILYLKEIDKLSTTFNKEAQTLQGNIEQSKGEISKLIKDLKSSPKEPSRGDLFSAISAICSNIDKNLNQCLTMHKNENQTFMGTRAQVEEISNVIKGHIQDSKKQMGNIRTNNNVLKSFIEDMKNNLETAKKRRVSYSPDWKRESPLGKSINKKERLQIQTQTTPNTKRSSFIKDTEIDTSSPILSLKSASNIHLREKLSIDQLSKNKPLSQSISGFDLGGSVRLKEQNNHLETCISNIKQRFEILSDKAKNFITSAGKIVKLINKRSVEEEFTIQVLESDKKLFETHLKALEGVIKQAREQSQKNRDLRLSPKNKSKLKQFLKDEEFIDLLSASYSDKFDVTSRNSPEPLRKKILSKDKENGDRQKIKILIDDFEREHGDVLKVISPTHSLVEEIRRSPRVQRINSAALTSPNLSPKALLASKIRSETSPEFQSLEFELLFLQRRCEELNKERDRMKEELNSFKKKPMGGDLASRMQELNEENEKLIEDNKKLVKVAKKLEQKAQERKNTIRKLYSLMSEKEKQLELCKKNPGQNSFLPKVIEKFEEAINRIRDEDNMKYEQLARFVQEKETIISHLESEISQLWKKREETKQKSDRKKAAIHKNRVHTFGGEGGEVEEKSNELMAELEAAQDLRKKMEANYQEEINILNNKVQQLNRHIEELESKNNQKLKSSINSDKLNRILSPKRNESSSLRDQEETRTKDFEDQFNKDINEVDVRINQLLQYLGVGEKTFFDFGILVKMEKLEAVIKDREEKLLNKIQEVSMKQGMMKIREGIAGNSEEIEELKKKMKDQQNLINLYMSGMNERNLDNKELSSLLVMKNQEIEAIKNDFEEKENENMALIEENKVLEEIAKKIGDDYQNYLNQLRDVLANYGLSIDIEDRDPEDYAQQLINIVETTLEEIFKMKEEFENRGGENEAIKELEGANQELTEIAENLKSELEKKDLELVKIFEQKMEMQEENEALKNELEKLKESILEQAEDIQEDRPRAAQGGFFGSREAFEKKKKATKNTGRTDRDEIIELKLVIEEKEKLIYEKVEEISERDKLMREQEKKFSETKSELTRKLEDMNNNFWKETQQYNEKIESLNKKANKLKEQLKNVEAELKESKENILEKEKVKDDLEIKLKEQFLQNKHLTENLKALQGIDHIKKDLEKELKFKENEIHHKEEENKSLKERLIRANENLEDIEDICRNMKEEKMSISLEMKKIQEDLGKNEFELTRFRTFNQELENKANEAQRQVDKISKEKEKVVQELEDAKDQINDLNNKYEEDMEDLIKNLNNQKEEMEAELVELKNKLEESEKNMKVFKTKFDQSDLERQKMENVLKDLNKSMIGYVREIESLKETNDSLKGQILEGERVIEEQGEEIEELRRQIENDENALLNFKEEISKKDTTLEDFKDEIEELKEKNIKLQKSIHDLERKALEGDEDYNQKIEDLIFERDTIKKELEQLREDLITQNQVVRQKEAEILQEKTGIQTMKKEFEKALTQKDQELETYKKGIEMELTNLKERIEELENLNESLGIEKDESNARMSKYVHELELANSNIQQLEQSLCTLNNEKNQYEEKIHTYERKIQELEISINEKENLLQQSVSNTKLLSSNEISNLKTTLNDYQKKFAESEQKMREFEKIISEYQSKNDHLNKHIEHLKNEKENLEKDLESKQNEVENLLIQESGHNDLIIQLKAEIKGFEAKLEESHEKINKLSKDYVDLQKEKDDIRYSTSQKDQFLAEKAMLVEKQTEEIDALKANISLHKESLAEANGKIESFSKELKKTKDENQYYKHILDTKGAEHSEINSKLTEYENIIDEERREKEKALEDFGNLEIKINKYESENNQIKEALVSLRKECEDLKSINGDLNKKIKEKEDEIRSLKEIINAAQKDKENLKEEIARLGKELSDNQLLLNQKEKEFEEEKVILEKEYLETQHQMQKTLAEYKLNFNHAQEKLTRLESNIEELKKENAMLMKNLTQEKEEVLSENFKLIEGLKVNISNLEQACEMKNEEIDAIKLKNEDLLSQIEKQNENVILLKQAWEEKDQEILRIDGIVRQKDSELKELQDKLDVSKKEYSEICNKMGIIAKEKEDAQTENTLTKNSLEIIKEELSSLQLLLKEKEKQLGQSMNERNQEMEEMKQKAFEAEEKIEGLSNTNNLLEKQITKAKEDNEHLKNENDQMRTKLNEMREILTESEKQVLESKVIIEQISKDLQETRENLSQCKIELNEANKKMTSLENNIKTLGEGQEEFKTGSINKDKEISELQVCLQLKDKELLEKKAEFEHEYSDLEKKLSTYEKEFDLVREDIVKLESQLREAKNSNKELKTTIHNKDFEIKKMTDLKLQDEEGHKKAIQGLQEEIERLKNEIESREQQHHTELKELSHGVFEIRQVIQEKEEELVQKDCEIEELRLKVEEYEKRNDMGKKKEKSPGGHAFEVQDFAEFDNQFAEFENFTEGFSRESKRKTSAILSRDVRDMKEKIEDLGAKCERLERERSKLLQEINDSKLNETNLKTRISELQAELDQQSDHNSLKQENKENSQESQSEQSDQVEQLKNTLVIKNREIVELRTNGLIEIEKVRSEYREQIDELNEEIEALRERNDEILKEYESLEVEYVNLKRKHDSLQTQNEQIKSEATSLNKKIESLQLEINGYKNKEYPFISFKGIDSDSCPSQDISPDFKHESGTKKEESALEDSQKIEVNDSEELKSKLLNYKARLETVRKEQRSLKDENGSLRDENNELRRNMVLFQEQIVRLNQNSREENSPKRSKREDLEISEALQESLRNFLHIRSFKNKFEPKIADANDVKKVMNQIKEIVQIQEREIDNFNQVSRSDEVITSFGSNRIEKMNLESEPHITEVKEFIALRDTLGQKLVDIRKEITSLVDELGLETPFLGQELNSKKNFSQDEKIIYGSLNVIRVHCKTLERKKSQQKLWINTESERGYSSARFESEQKGYYRARKSDENVEKQRKQETPKMELSFSNPDDLEDIKARSFLHDSYDANKVTEEKDEGHPAEQRIKSLFEQIRRLQDENEKLHVEYKQLKDDFNIVKFLNEDLKAEIQDKEEMLKKLSESVQERKPQQQSPSRNDQEKEHVKQIFLRFLDSALQGNKDWEDLLRILLTLLGLSERDKNDFIANFKTKASKKGLFSKIFK